MITEKLQQFIVIKKVVIVLELQN